MSPLVFALLERLVFEIRQIRAQGTAWYGRKQLAKVWKARSTTKSRRSRSRPEMAEHTDGQRRTRPVADRPLLKVSPHPDDGGPGQELREGAQQQDKVNGPCPPRLRLVGPSSAESE